MGLPDTARVSLRQAIIWIAYGEAEAPDDLAGDALWYSRDEAIDAARKRLWTALEDGSLEAWALDPDSAPTIIGKHEWPFLFGRAAVVSLSMNARSLSMNPLRKDALCVGGPDERRLGLRQPRFREVTLARIDVLANCPPPFETAPDPQGGRPSAMPQIKQELDRWILGGFDMLLFQLKKYDEEGNRSGAAVARALAKWAVLNRLKDPPQWRAIQNELRDKVRQAAEIL
jgi:hypothetical protein